MPSMTEPLQAVVEVVIYKNWHEGDRIKFTFSMGPRSPKLMRRQTTSEVKMAYNDLLTVSEAAISEGVKKEATSIKSSGGKFVNTPRFSCITSLNLWGSQTSGSLS